MPIQVALALLFALGVVHDFLAYRCLTLATSGRSRATALLSATLTAFSYAAWSLMVSTGVHDAPLGIACYSIGCGAGAWLALRRGVGAKSS